MPFVEWAESNIQNPDGSAFRFRATQRQPAKDLFNPSISSLTLRAYSGMGKTYLISAGLIYAIDQLQTAVAVMFPNADLAEDWVSDEWSKVADATPAIRDLPKVRDIKRYKRWLNGGELFAVGANSSGRIRRLQASVLYADEIDAIEQDSGDEGDKLAQFLKRGRGRKEQHKWLTSYPSLRGASKVDAAFNQSDQCRYYVRCPECEAQFEPHTRQLVWTPGQPEDAAWICPECESRNTDKDRRKAAEDGEYLDKDMQPPKDGTARGYHVNCMAHTGDHNSAYSGYLHEIAAEIEKGRAADNPEKARRVFVNTMDAESYAEVAESKPEPEGLYARREDYKPMKRLPENCLVLTAGVDVQKDRLEACVMGWGCNAEAFGVRYLTMTGSPLTPEPWQKLDHLLAMDFPLESGSIRIAACFVDSGKWQDSVYEFTRPRARRRVFAVKGAKMIDRPLFDGKPSRVGRPVTTMFNVGTHEAKDLIYQRLSLEIGEDGTVPRGYLHYPDNAEFGPQAGGDASGFFQMLTAEDSRMKRSTATGEFVRFFECPKGVRNEALDTTVYALAAERFLKPQYEVIYKKRHGREWEGHDQAGGRGPLPANADSAD